MKFALPFVLFSGAVAATPPKQSKSAVSNLNQRIDALESRVERNRHTMNSAARQEARDTLEGLREQRIRIAE